MTEVDTIQMWIDEFARCNKKLDEAYQKIRELELKLTDARINKLEHDRAVETKVYAKRCRFRERLNQPNPYYDYDE